MTNNKTIYIHDDVLETKAEDSFGHQHISDAIIESISNTKPPFIIGVFGGWGTGKSSILHMIIDQLPKTKYASVMIDAWRYTSSDNLSRAFLVHIANELAPNLLDKLRRKLFTSEQEVVPFKKSIFDEDSRKFSFSDIFKASKPILYFLLWCIFFIILFLVWFTCTALLEYGVDDFWTNLDWEGLRTAPLEIAIFPLLLTLANSLRLYFVQRPVTVIHERIDADELFSDYFNKIVKKAVGNKINKKKLVVFVDNLDRLSDDKIVEALESLKTYISNKDCIFIVSCDDNVVREVINKSDMVPDEKGGNLRKAGEHYLDKFFQQTFRVPEYMGLNLQEYAYLNFSQTELFVKLIKRNIDIRHLISIIIPSDISSPRKVKRLLNEFIALYNIVERREATTGGQIRPGLLTENPYFLAKFSTIRAEYYYFYNQMLSKSDLLNKITSSIEEKRNGSDSPSSILSNVLQEDHESLLKYLRKTQTISVKDVQPYIWLCQDALSLDLLREHYIQLQEGLQNGDIEQVKELFDKLDGADNEYKTLFFRVAGKLLDGRLQGLEQENGGRVLADLLPIIPDGVKAEIANHLARLLPNWNLSVFPTNDVLNILKWVNSANSDQKSNLINMLIERLNKEETREETFESILNQPNVIRDNGAEDNVQKWLDELLKSTPNPDTETVNEPIQNNPNSEFIAWIIDKTTDYEDDDLVLSVYYCKSVIRYVFTQINLLGINNSEEENSVNLENNRYFKFLRIIKDYLLRGGKADSYWIGIINLLSQTKSLEEYSVCSHMIRELERQIPSHLSEELISAILKGTANVAPQKESSDDFVGWLEVELGFIFILQRIQNTGANVEASNDLSDNFIRILKIPSAIDECCRFITNFVKEFSIGIASPFMYAFIEVLRVNITNADYRGPFVDTLISLDDELDVSTRSELMHIINEAFALNTPDSLSQAQEIVQKISILSTYKEEITNSATGWLSAIQNEAIPIINAKLAVIDEIRKVNILPASSICTRLIELIPFTGEQDKLILCINYLLTIRPDINDESGINLFHKIISNISSFSTNKSQTLLLIAKWVRLSIEQDLKSIFIDELKKIFNSDPKTANEILANNNIWETLDETDAIDLLSEIYLFPESEFRKKNAVNAIKRLNSSKRLQIIIDTWEHLKDKVEANLFIRDILEVISLEEVLAIRNNAMDQVRENAVNETAEPYLILLQATIRKDVREIMPIVDLFGTLLNTQRSNIDLAVKHIVNCIKPFSITSTHKKILIDRVKVLQTRFHDDPQLMSKLDTVIKELKLKTWGMLKHW